MMLLRFKNLKQKKIWTPYIVNSINSKKSKIPIENKFVTIPRRMNMGNLGYLN